MIKTIIIEDEAHSYELLASIITEYCPCLQLIGHAKSVSEGAAMLSEVSCDLVFLDIQLDDGISFELLQKLDKWNFAIIFTTALHHYAVDAFKVEAVDYLLKPYSPKQVIKAVEKVRRKMQAIPSEQLKFLLENSGNPTASKISLHTQEGISIFNKDEIICCKAEGAYCLVMSDDHSSLLVSKTLGDIEAMLASQHFIRVHASHLVNTRHIKKYLKEDGGSLLMSNGAQIPVSRRKKQEVMDILEF